ncbi:hypothetical protein BGZ65_006124 [Modicella reniformis]|uniref:Uncharacterized protein n=1 Tax=Modicella reniformis TaxID=1440133 RepID=A0A9P6ST67_9FUNG|nr:hypothetical protein BGZ65_006124 [Modicella reniformis]
MPRLDSDGQVQAFEFLTQGVPLPETDNTSGASFGFDDQSDGAEFPPDVNGAALGSGEQNEASERDEQSGGSGTILVDSFDFDLGMASTLEVLGQQHYFKVLEKAKRVV